MVRVRVRVKVMVMVKVRVKVMVRVMVMVKVRVMVIVRVIVRVMVMVNLKGGKWMKIDEKWFREKIEEIKEYGRKTFAEEDEIEAWCDALDEIMLELEKEKRKE